MSLLKSLQPRDSAGCWLRCFPELRRLSRNMPVMTRFLEPWEGVGLYKFIKAKYRFSLPAKTQFWCMARSFLATQNTGQGSLISPVSRWLSPSETLVSNVENQIFPTDVTCTCGRCKRSLTQSGANGTTHPDRRQCAAVHHRFSFPAFLISSYTTLPNVRLRYSLTEEYIQIYILTMHQGICSWN